MSERYLNVREVALRVGLSRATIYRKIKIGDFPDSYDLSDNRVGWRESDIDAWIVSRKQSRARERTPISAGRRVSS